jgi:hypothetical protein
MNFANFFFKQLPSFFKRNDTYKDSSGKGLLERYLEIFGEELDAEVVPLIENYIKNVNPEEVIPKYLTHLAYTVGNPPDLLGDPNKYAKLLKHILTYYKVKGTKKGYEIFFALLGWNVTVIELPPLAYRFDVGLNLDGNNKWATFDSACPKCSDYELIIWPYNADCSIPEIPPIDLALIQLLYSIIYFNEPINATLVAFIMGASVCEEAKFCIEERVAISINRFTKFDLNPVLELDNLQTMDTSEKILSFEINTTCQPLPDPDTVPVLATEALEPILTENNDYIKP